MTESVGMGPTPLPKRSPWGRPAGVLAHPDTGAVTPEPLPNLPDRLHNAARVATFSTRWTVCATACAAGGSRRNAGAVVATLGAPMVNRALAYRDAHAKGTTHTTAGKTQRSYGEEGREGRGARLAATRGNR
jgi:hypothetical protein